MISYIHDMRNSSLVSLTIHLSSISKKRPLYKHSKVSNDSDSITAAPSKISNLVLQ